MIFISILVFGSLNIDQTYKVDHIVRPGETLSVENPEFFCGGKGFNQAIATARAGQKVSFAGAVGNDGDPLLAALEAEGIDVSLIQKRDGPSGHAIIQVDSKGQNSILVIPGTNGSLSKEDVDNSLEKSQAGDIILLQNEISCIEYIIEKAHKKGLFVVFNPSPCDARAKNCKLEYVDLLLINKTEGVILSGEVQPEKIIETIHARFPRMKIALTLGENGSVFCDETGRTYQCGVYKTEVKDTTAAGDTFTGYLVSALINGKSIELALLEASTASGIAVSRKGASASIPDYSAVAEAVEKQRAGKLTALPPDKKDRYE